MKFLLLVMALLVAGSLRAQSPFASIPKRSPRNIFARDVFLPDSTSTMGRFIASIAAYSEPGNIAEGGFGYGLQNLKWDWTTMKWYCNWSVSAVAFGGGSVVPSTPSSIVSVAIMGGVLNNLLMIGPQYNFGTKQFGVAISIGISLNN